MQVFLGVVKSETHFRVISIMKPSQGYPGDGFKSETLLWVFHFEIFLQNTV